MSTGNGTGIVAKAVEAAMHWPGLSFGEFWPCDSDRGDEDDGVVRITYKGRRKRFRVLVRNPLHRTVIERLVAERSERRGNPPPLVVSHQIGDKHADILVKAGIAFLDTAGNVFLSVAGLCLVVTGRKAGSPIAKAYAGRAFRSTGLKLIFAILTDPRLDSSPRDALINRPYRAVRQRTGVSPASVGLILGDLEASGHVVDDGGVRLLLDRAKLLQKWGEAYADRLWSRRTARRFAAPSRDWWQHVRLDAPRQLWGGETAAAKLTGMLKPQVATVYTRQPAHGLILDAGLRVDPDGDVEFVAPFWGDWTHAADRDCTHPLLVYADLLATDLDRNLEAAQRVYDAYLRSIVESA
ncbi:MAG: hypothetical protein JXR37_01520 [Kiritimatiellae bacterium]|nr:hypothetical protein [Kiritimatiellia bacterium]